MHRLSTTIYLAFLFCANLLIAQNTREALNQSDKLFPIRGLAIAAPRPKGVDRFVKFINEELAPRKVNTLILRVDYNFQYESYPSLRDSIALSKSDVKKLVEACSKIGIKIIPQINLLGHQSWASQAGNLITKFPEFDETP